MLEGVINDARRAASRLLATYLGRAVVAVPFVFAAGFATAAATLWLIDQFGTQIAYWIMALGFAIVGLIASVIVTVKEEEVEQAAEEEEKEAAASSPLATAESVLAPAAMLLPFLNSSAGLSTSAKLAKYGLKFIPIMVLAALLTALLWPLGEQESKTGEVPDTAPHPGGVTS